MRIRSTGKLGLTYLALRTLSFALLISLPGSRVSGEAASVSHEITLAITPIIIIEVHEYKDIAAVLSSDGNSTITTLTTDYGVTCLSVNASVQAMLVKPLPEGVTIQARMKSAIGRSLGWVTLVSGTSTNLVSDISGAEYNEIDIAMDVPNNVDIGPVNVEIVYSIGSTSG